MSSLFSKPKTPPPLTAPAVMPTPDDDAVMAAKRRKTAEAMAGSGRQSTVKSDQLSDTLG